MTQGLSLPSSPTRKEVSAASQVSADNFHLYFLPCTVKDHVLVRTYVVRYSNPTSFFMLFSAYPGMDIASLMASPKHNSVCSQFSSFSCCHFANFCHIFLPLPPRSSRNLFPFNFPSVFIPSSLFMFL